MNDMTKFGHISKTKQFQMMNGGSTSISQLPDGTEIDVQAAAIVTVPETEKDPEKNILYLVGCDGVIYSTISQTAAKSFVLAVDILGTHELTLIKKSGKSKNGRVYIDLDVAGGNYDDE